MNELISALLLVVSQVAHMPVPDAQPVIKEVSQEEIVTRACGEETARCKDLYFYTDPYNGDILVANGIDWKYTFAQAELLIELGRFTYTHHGYYNLTNDCKVQATLENTLEQMRWDYMRGQLIQGKYVGEGLPEIKDLPHHVFYCGASKLPEVKI